MLALGANLPFLAAKKEAKKPPLFRSGKSYFSSRPHCDAADPRRERGCDALKF